jgi:hypothetical protein
MIRRNFLRLMGCLPLVGLIAKPKMERTSYPTYIHRINSKECNVWLDNIRLLPFSTYVTYDIIKRDISDVIKRHLAKGGTSAQVHLIWNTETDLWNGIVVNEGTQVSVFGH